MIRVFVSSTWRMDAGECSTFNSDETLRRVVASIFDSDSEALSRATLKSGQFNVLVSILSPYCVIIILGPYGKRSGRSWRQAHIVIQQ